MGSSSRYSNCLFFAIRMWWRRAGKAVNPGIGLRESHSGPFWHFKYQELRRGRVREISFKPLHPVKRTFPPPLFLGSVCWGDNPPEKPHAKNPG